MDAITYADHLVVLERLASSPAAEREGVVEQAREWTARLDSNRRAADLLRRQVEVLSQLASAHPESDTRSRCRAALAYLLGGTDAPERLGELALRVRCFVLALVLHDVRAHVGGELVEVSSLAAAERARARALFEELLERPPLSDEQLVELVRHRCAEFPIHPEAPLASRLLRNAEFLLSVLQSADATAEERRQARAGLTYLVTREVEAPNDLGLGGLVDDAYILDSVVAGIEPARQGWIRLVEAAARSLPELGPLTMGGRPAPPSMRRAPVEAALLSEPWVQSGPLSRALFVPTSGVVPLLLAVASVIEGASRTRDALVVFASPAERVDKLLSALRVDARPVEELVAIQPWAVGSPVPTGPSLVLMDSLSDVSAMLTHHGARVWVALIDLEVAAPMPAPATVRAAEPLPAHYVDDAVAAAYAKQAQNIPRLSAEQEIELSVTKAQARAEIVRGLELLGERAPELLPAGTELGKLSDEACGELLRRLDAPASEPHEGPAAERAAWLEGREMVRRGLSEVDRVVGELTRANLRLVMWVAHRFPRSNKHFLDMVQEGNLGLMRAARLFDHTKGARFGSYAVLWIRQAVAAYLQRVQSPVRVPDSVLRAAYRVRAAQRQMSRSLGRPPTAEELAERLELDLEMVRRVLHGNHQAQARALDEPVAADRSELLQDRLADRDAVPPSERIWADQVADEARRMLAELPPREEEVLRLRFGLETGKPMTLRQIGERYGVTRERVRQLELRALARLRKRFGSDEIAALYRVG